MKVLRKFARLLDQFAINMMLGTIVKQVTLLYEKEGYPSQEARALARQEMMASLDGLGVDIESYYAVREWKNSYMAMRAKVAEILERQKKEDGAAG
jgi:hypothetical protein